MKRSSNSLGTKLFACVLSLAITAGLMPLSAFAGAETAPSALDGRVLTLATEASDSTAQETLGLSIQGTTVTVTDWSGLQSAINESSNGDVIELGKDIINTQKKDRIKVDGKTVTIDLKGNALNRNRTSLDLDGHVIEVVNGGNLTIQDSAGGGTITGGYALRGGGINIDASSTCTIEGGTITENKASLDGGGICVHGVLTMTGGTVSNNTASDTGGGIYVADTGSFTLNGVVITKNTASNKGGGINMHLKADSSISNCQITNNTCSITIGGGIHMDAQGKKLTIADTQIEHNTSKISGAGIYLHSGIIEMTGGSLSNNVSGIDGGGAKITPKTTFTTNGVDISKNEAKSEKGGGIKNQGTTTLKNCTVDNNTAKKPGGGIFNDGDEGEGNLTLENCDINNNHSESYGGGICSDKKLTIKGSTISYNSSADGKGNGIFIGKGSDTTDIEGKIIVQKNESSFNGQEVFLDSGQKLNLSGSLSEGTIIGITIQDALGTFTTGYKMHQGSADPSKFFFSPEGMKIALVASGDESGEVCLDGKLWIRDCEYSFSNSSRHFNTGVYTMLDSDYQKMCTYIDKMGYGQAYKDLIADKRTMKWSGSCFGMSMTTLLDYSGQIAFNENFDPGKETMYAVSSPSSSEKVMSAITYYHLSQLLPKVRETEITCTDGYSGWSDGLEQLVSKARKREPMRFGYFYKVGGSSYGHSIVIKGYDGTDSEGNHKLVAYDNRSPNKDVMVIVSENYSTCVIKGTSGDEVAYKVKFTSDFSPYDMIDIDGPNNDMVISVSANDQTQSASGTTIYVPSSGEFRVENQAGKKLQVSDGVITDSTMEVIEEYMIVNSTEDGEAAPGELAITVADSDSFTFTSESKSIDASVVGDGYYSDVTAENADSVTISEEGTNLRGDKINYSVTQSVSSDLCEMFSCSGTTDGDGTISFLDGRINVSGHAGGDVTLEVFIDGKAKTFSARSFLKNLSISIADLLNPSVYSKLLELIKGAKAFGFKLYQVTQQEGAPEIESSNIQEVSAVILGTEAIYKYIELAASPLDGTVPEADKAALTSKANELGATAGIWFDLSLYANGRASNKHLEQVATVQTPLDISITVPEELQKDGRTFFILSAHDGKVKQVAKGSKETLTWSNTGFSTFLLAYADEPPAPSETVTISFDANGGSGSMDSITVEAGESVVLPANKFTRSGYSFDGWNTAKNGKGTAHSDKATVQATEDVTLYAQWKASSSEADKASDSTATKTGSASSASTGKASATPQTGDSIPLGAIVILLFVGLAALIVSRSRLNRGDN